MSVVQVGPRPHGQDVKSNTKGVDYNDVRRSPGIPVESHQKRQHAKRGDSPQRTILPWEAFLPTGHDSGSNGWPDLNHYHHSSKGTDFKELVSEGKKRLEKAGREQQLRERAKEMGAMGGCELEELLADLCEPSFSRRQNE